MKMMTSCHVSVFFLRRFTSHRFALGRNVAIFTAKCFFFFSYSEMTVFFSSKTELTSEEKKCSKNVTYKMYHALNIRTCF